MRFKSRQLQGVLRIIVVCTVIFISAQIAFANDTADLAFQKVNFLINFSDYHEGSIDEWLKKKGFKFERGARNRRLIDFDIREDALVIEANKNVRGFLINELVDLEEYSKVRPDSLICLFFT